MFTKKKNLQDEVLNFQRVGRDSISAHRDPSWNRSHLARYGGLGPSVAGTFAGDRDEAIIFESDQRCSKTLMRI
jgi:hypothetical protein